MTLEDRLKRTQYHWILGLRELKEPCERNLWDQIQAMQPNEIERLRHQQAEIRQKIWPLRLFYWLFNLASYAERHYLLIAYVQLNKGTPMYNPSEKTGYFTRAKKLFQNFVLPTASPETMNDTEEPKPPEDAFTPEPRARPVVNLPAVVTPNMHEELLVQSWMQPSLRLLGIERLDQNTLRFPEVKKAYHTQALAFHPDKNPSPEAQATFVQIAKAYETLNAAFCGTVTQAGFSSYTYADLWQELNKLHGGIQDIIQQCKADLATLAENQKKLDNMTLKLDNMTLKLDNMTLKLDNMTPKLDNMTPKLDKNQRMIDECQRKFDIIKQRRSIGNGQSNQQLPVGTIQTKEENRSVPNERLSIIEPIERPIPTFFKMSSKVSHQFSRSAPQNFNCPVVKLERSNVHPAVIGASITHETLSVQPEMQSLLKVLGIERSVHTRLHLSDLNKAYRAQALFFHPDKNSAPIAKTKFVQIAEAYETLKASFCENEKTDDQPKGKLTE